MCLRRILAPHAVAATPRNGHAEPLLVAAIADGDEWAMADLYRTYADGVRRLARSLTSASAADADDVVQETFAKVWGAAATFDPQRGSEATFVFTIARRVIIDRWRKVTRRPVTAPMWLELARTERAGETLEARDVTDPGDP